jgi:DNA-binding NarL/FixJ family response regulator
VPLLAQQPIRVAIVDDHRMLLNALAEWLRSAGTRIRVVATVTSWPELLAHPEFPVDVALLDLDLGDGLDIGLKIRTLGTAGTATVVISAHAHPATIRRALHAGASGYLVKSESTETIIDTITGAAAGAVFVTPHVESLLDDLLVAAALTPQEKRIVALYAAGHPLKNVASELNITLAAANAHLRRARAKYRTAGFDAGTKLALRELALRDNLTD